MVNKAYALAKERYAEIGVDTEKVLEQMQDFHLSLHCWQADDVKGFEVQAGAMSGGIPVMQLMRYVSFARTLIVCVFPF